MITRFNITAGRSLSTERRAITWPALVPFAEVCTVLRNVDLDALVTAAEAAASPHLRGVSRHLIGMWKLAGKLPVRGKRGRSPLYRYGDIMQVERDTRRSGYSHRLTA